MSKAKDRFIHIKVDGKSFTVHTSETFVSAMQRHGFDPTNGFLIDVRSGNRIASLRDLEDCGHYDFYPSSYPDLPIGVTPALPSSFETQKTEPVKSIFFEGVSSKERNTIIIPSVILAGSLSDLHTHLGLEKVTSRIVTSPLDLVGNVSYSSVLRNNL